MAHCSRFIDGPLGLIGTVLMGVLKLVFLVRLHDPALPRLDPLAEPR